MGWQDLWGCASAGLGIQVPSLPCQGVAALPSWDTPSQAYPPRQALDDGVPGSPAAVPALGVVEDQGGRQGEETQEWATRALVGNQARRSPKAAVKDTNSWRGPSCTHREVVANRHIDGQMMAVVATCFWDPSSPWQPRAAGEEATQGVKKSTELVWAETPQRFGAKGHPAACQSLPDISPMFLKAFPFFFFFLSFCYSKKKIDLKSRIRLKNTKAFVQKQQARGGHSSGAESACSRAGVWGELEQGKEPPGPAPAMCSHAGPQANAKIFGDTRGWPC